MCGSTPAAPPPPPIAPEAPRAPEPSAGDGGRADQQRRAAAAGRSPRGTILTGSRGVSDSAATSGKTLLGQ